MKHLLSILLAFCQITAIAQTEITDTALFGELNEITVEARMQSTSATASTYSPSGRQKNAATDGVSLLSQMAIPQLDVNPSEMTVTTISGQPVSIFIDYVPASSQDLSGLMPRDVRKVEYLLNPQDPRFKGAPYVVNFIMRRKEWGGYTKLYANGSVGVKRYSGDLYSKFAIKSMTFDLYAGYLSSTDRHRGSRSKETFLFNDLMGEGPRTVDRVSTPLSSHYRDNSTDITFRALYASDKAQVSNKVSFNRTSVPKNDSENILAYEDGFLPESLSRKTASTLGLSVNYEFDSYFKLSRKTALDIAAGYLYSHNKSAYRYEANGNEIINDADENVHSANINPRLVWNPDNHLSIMPTAQVIYASNGIDYRGNSPSRQVYRGWASATGVRIAYRRDRWSAGGLMLWTYTDTDLSGIRIRENFPTGNVFGSFSPNDRHQIEVGYNFGKVVPETFEKSPNMLRQDELMWYEGNPVLTNFWNQIIRASYVWMPSNVWQIAADSYYFFEDSRVVSAYTPDGPEGTMMRRYMNGGNSDIFMAGVSATAKLLGGKVIAKAHPQFWHRSVDGEYNITVNQVTCNAQITWYLGDFFLFGWYATPITVIGTDSGIKSRVPSSYQIQAGWRKGSWQLTATAFNFLRSSWESSRQSLSSHYYSLDATEYGTSMHMRYRLSVSYSFGYGKKVKRSDEVSGAGAAGSAILK